MGAAVATSIGRGTERLHAFSRSDPFRRTLSYIKRHHFRLSSPAIMARLFSLPATVRVANHRMASWIRSGAKNFQLFGTVRRGGSTPG